MNQSSSSSEEIVPISEAARRLGVSVDTLRRWDTSGKLSAIRLPSGQRRFRASDIKQLLAQRDAS